MSWHYFLLLSIAGEVSGRLLQRFLLKDTKSDPIAYAFLFQLFTGILIGVFAFFNGFVLPPFEKVWQNFLLMPLLFGVTNILIFKAIKLTEASVFTILFSTRIVWIVLGALFFFRESFSFVQCIGALFILSGVILVSWKKEKIKFHKGHILSLAAAFVFSLAILNDSSIVRHADVASYMSLAFIFPALFILCTHPHKTKEIKSLLDKKFIPKIILLSIFFGVSAVSYQYAYKFGNNAAQIGSIFQISSIFVVILAILLLHEKSSIKLKIIAGILSFIGVLLVV